MQAKYFGTDGIRDTIDSPLLSPGFLQKFAHSVADFLTNAFPETELKVVIGRDSRDSGIDIASQVGQCLKSHDINVLYFDIMPTPAIALATIEQRAHLGIVITASHNPANYNGLKLINHKGMKLTQQQELEIESKIDVCDHPIIDDVSPLLVSKIPSLAHYNYYAQTHCTSLENDSLKDWDIIVDTANGATTQTTPYVLQALGARVHCIGKEPNGHNINADVGSEYPQLLSKKVLEHKAKIGIAHDGDGDRVVVCDENGDLVDGDQLLGILAINMLKSGNLAQKQIVVTKQSNKGLDVAIEALGGTVHRTDIGDRHVLYKMHETGANLGGENSGHIICKDHLASGDGLIAALKLLEIMHKSGQALSILKEQIQLLPQKQKNLITQSKPPIDQLPQLSDTIQRMEASLGKQGRVFVRYSGTEPKLRFLVEAPDDKTCNDYIEQLIAAAQKDMQLST